MRLVGFAISGALIAYGLVTLVFVALQRFRVTPARPVPGRFSCLARTSRQTRLLFFAGLAGGVVVWTLTGWPLALVGVPLAVVGLPTLLSTSDAKSQIIRLEAMAEWTRSLSGVLTVGLGLEQALAATLRSTPEAIAPELNRLVARLQSRWRTEDALRAFADELDDATGDLIAANLILGARRRGAGLATVLASLAESVEADVRARRQVEADRAKPRATARWVTIISVAVLGALTFSGEYVAPYATPIGQVILAVLLAAYVALLIRLHTMATGKPLPRFLTTGVHP
ncbi:type II secretion system F family protein [Georgenia yuyongxinii]|uniref:Type II secretion system F family protein n=1 Tax=Georgenia yuyongxinii TaxID=2589797 RepID=A0A552WXE5_9MICO|nr:type II secretion system F family protein [Georgenia yuyongxinii]TRW47444.1 type II secretion system F family protein [Georgenia yuyongxinii]